MPGQRRLPGPAGTRQHRPVPSSLRTFAADDFDVDELVRAKGSTTVTVCLPARDEEQTVGEIVTAVHKRLVDDVALVDEVLVIDDHSTDGTAEAAADAGARVVSAASILPERAVGPGKGQAMWKSVYAATGDLIVWCDADLRDFDARLVTGLLGPMLIDPRIGFVKGCYHRPDDGIGGGRVTELVARPAIALLFPALAEVRQPLAGEYGGRREVLEALPFVGGYGVDLALLLDVARRFGVDAIAQVDLGDRHHRHRSLDQLGPMAVAVLHAALSRAGIDVPADVPLMRPECPVTEVRSAELPPVAELR